MNTKTDSAEIDTLKEDIARLREDITHLASAVLNTASDTFDDAKGKRSSNNEEAGDDLAGKMHEGLDHGRQLMDDLDARVTRNPVGSVLVAFGVGLLLSKILGSGGRS